jgi:hypothetical protein
MPALQYGPSMAPHGDHALLPGFITTVGMHQAAAPDASLPRRAAIIHSLHMCPRWPCWGMLQASPAA